MDKIQTKIEIIRRSINIYSGKNAIIHNNLKEKFGKLLIEEELKLEQMKDEYPEYFI